MNLPKISLLACLLFPVLSSFGQADLIITSPTISTTSVTASSSLSATCYIYNQGTSLASSSNVGYYLSTDAVWDAADTYLNYSSGASLNVSSSSYRSVTLTIPSSTTTGSYYILFYADYSNAVTESNENNNVSSLAITVVPSVVDLIIQSPTLSPVSLAAGGSVSTTCYIYNQGTSISSSSNVGYYLSTDAVWDAGDTYLNSSTGTSLAASSSSYRSVSLTIPSATTPGSYYILYFADYTNAVPESVETNNVVSLSISIITPVIDLIIQSQSASPTSVAAGGTLNASCYIYNQGNAAASSSNVGFYLSTDAIWDAGDTYLSSATGGILNASTSSSRSATLTIPGATTAGSYYILFFADYANAVVENVETNNVVAIAINVLKPIVDLTIQSQSATPVSVASGAVVSASCYIYNQGNVVVSSSNVGYYLSTDPVWDAGDTYLSYSAGSTLNPSASSSRSASLTIPSATAPGSYYILFFADYSNVVVEDIETNNVNYVAITVAAPVIDLIVQSQTASPLSIGAGSTTSASCYIYNQGNTSAASSNVGYYLSSDATWDAADTYLSYSTGSTLAAGTSSSRSATLTIPSATTPGSYYILYYADYSNVVTESIETNNVVSVPITIVTPTVDLIIQSQSAPSSVVAGNSISASCYIYNQGNSIASSSNVGYYLSTDATWDAGDTYLNYTSGASLAAASSSYRSASLTIPSATTPGSYYILFYADYSNVVSENIETNNVSSSLITVTTPYVDLIIQSQTASPTTVSSGASVSVSCYIYNQGNAIASASNVGYYLSTDATWNASDVYLNYSSGTSLSAGSSSYRSASLTIPSATTNGNYYILFYADYSNVVSESIESNNVSSVYITVAAPTIDLIIQTPGVSPSSVVAGNSVSVSCYIYNQGNTLASSSNVGYYLSSNTTWDGSDVYLNSSSGSSLAATSSSYRSAAVTIPSGTTPGSYYILYYADYSNVVTETVETNNVAYVALTVSAPYIDLIIQSQSISPTTIAAGGNVSASCYIYNQGNSVSTTSDVGYYLSTNSTWDASDVLLNNSTGGSLNASSSAYKSTTLTIPSTTAAGSYYIIFYADYLLSVSESVESNNYLSSPLTVTPFTNVIQVPYTGSNQYTVCSGTVYDNGGTGYYSNYSSGTTTLLPATSGNMIRLSFNSFSVETCCDFLQIYDGTSTSATLIGTYTSNPGVITASNTSGALTLYFYSDGSGTDLGFDATVSCVSSGSLPDLSPINLACSPLSIKQGDSAVVTCQVLNSGGSSAASSILGYFLSTDTIWDFSDTYLSHEVMSSLAVSAFAASTRTVTIPAITPTGPYYLLFVADTGKVITENLETNNVKWLQITVTSMNGISSSDQDKYISVFPNPTSGPVNFVFSAPLENSASIRIFDCIGKLTDAFTVDIAPNAETKVLYEMQKRGVYLAEITMGEKIFFRKIIVQ